MLRSLYRQVVLCLFVGLFFGLVNGACACSDDDDHCNLPSDSHCSVHCVCQQPAVTADTDQPLLPVAGGASVVAPDIFLKLPLVATSIFQPPRA